MDVKHGPAGRLGEACALRDEHICTHHMACRATALRIAHMRRARGMILVTLHRNACALHAHSAWHGFVVVFPKESSVRIHPPHGKTGACCVLASATVAVIAFFALGIADGSSVSAQAAPVITPVGPITNLAARPYGALLPIVVGPANTPTAAPTPTPVATATPTPPPGAVPAPTPPASPREAAALYHSERGELLAGHNQRAAPGCAGEANQLFPAHGRRATDKLRRHRGRGQPQP